MNGSPGRALIGAAACFTIALFVFGNALLRAMSPGLAVEPLPPAAQQPAADSTTSDASLTMDALMLAVENDPFTPERTRAAERYRLPGDVEPEPEPEPPAPPPIPQFRLSGTVATADGGLALIQVAEEPPRMMTIGDALQGYRLVAVSAQGAVMANDERQVRLTVPSPARTAQVAGPQRGGQNARNAQGRAQTPAQNAAAMRQVLDRARQAGATPQMLESLMRMMEERGISAIEQLEIGPNGFSFRSGNTSVRSTTREMAVPPPPPPPQSQQWNLRARPDTMEIR